MIRMTHGRSLIVGFCACLVAMLPIGLVVFAADLMYRQSRPVMSRPLSVQPPEELPSSERPPEQLAIDGLWVGWVFLFGACIGSFLNVVVYRVPQGISIVSKPSYCPKCRTPIRFRDNVPICGWIWLRGQCRACRQPISARYPIVEFVVAVLFQWLFVWEVVRAAGVVGPDGNGVASSGILDMFVTNQWHPLAMFAYHAFVLGSLIAIALMAFDQHAPSRSMIGFVLMVSLLVGTLWPEVVLADPRYVGPFSSLPATNSTPLATLLGFVVGFVGGYLAGRLVQAMGYSRTLSAAVLWSIVLIGTSTGWQAAVLAVAAVVISAIAMSVMSRSAKPTASLIVVGSAVAAWGATLLMMTV